jgi:hypothetical protein
VSLKFADGSETDLTGLLAPVGGPFAGKDIQGEFFSAKTDFALDLIPGERPLLYNHGLDAKADLAVVGRIKSLSRDEAGLWMKAQLDAASDYYGAIRDLIKAGKLCLSSGSMRHLVRMGKSGEILRWPLVEGSLTPTPANPMAEVQFAAAKSHFAAIGGDLSDDMDGNGLEPLAVNAEQLATEAASLVERTKDLHERRVKAGRVISTMNRQRLSACVGSMRTACDDLQALLDSTDPAAVEAKALTVRRARARAMAFAINATAN